MPFVLVNGHWNLVTLPRPPSRESRMTEQATALGQNDLEAIKRVQNAFKEIKKQLGRVIVGQDHVIEELLIALFSRGHCILEGVPGLAKTLMISTLAKC